VFTAKLTAGSGIGFAICQRLIAQLSSPSPPDALPRQQCHTPPPLYPITPHKQLTLILACRNPKRAHAARRDLLAFADAELSRQKKHAIDENHAEEFRRGLNIDCLSLDLTSMQSVFEFAKEARRQYSFHFTFLSKFSTMVQVSLCYSPYP
jgi:3-keto steroid reductase